MKVVGAKVEDSIYQRIVRLGNISNIVRSALYEYLINHENKPESLVNPQVNHKNKVDECIDINDKIDSLIKAKN